MDRTMRMVFAGGVTLLLGGLAFLVYLGYLHNNPTAARANGGSPGPAAITGPPLRIPPFSLVDQDNQPRDRGILEGRVSVVWFMFTHCPLACPAMSVQMAELQKGLRNSGVQFVAFSLDPVHDTPSALKTYGEKYGIDWSNWTFLTEPAGSPTKRTGWSIYADDLMQYVEETPTNTLTLAEGGTMANIEHAVNFFVVGPDGEVLDRGWYSSLHPEELVALRERVIASMKFYGDQGRLKR